ncbi:MAG TPA: type ISP restriction/modification enzyme [Pirellulaceae bacterium]|nr:type ISP restriction/modification enzyme [Pirellulaceae bacterium]
MRTRCAVYGLLHHPGYRTKYPDNLKRELPRIPFAPEFRPFAKVGENLAKLHLDYEQLKPYDLDFIETPGLPLSYRVEDKMRLSKDKLRLAVNPSLTLAGIPPEVFDYRLGNRSALGWVIEQYQVSTDKRSGITSDPTPWSKLAASLTRSSASAWRRSRLCRGCRQSLSQSRRASFASRLHGPWHSFRVRGNDATRYPGLRLLAHPGLRLLTQACPGLSCVGLSGRGVQHRRCGPPAVCRA